MDAETIVYALHWFVVIGALVVSWIRARHFLHPHFMFTTMFVVYLSDFLVRGYDVNNSADLLSQRLNDIAPAELYTYQISILTAILVILFITLFVRNRGFEHALPKIAGSLALHRQLQLYALGIATVLIAGELLKRLSSVGWSPAEVLMESLGVRGNRPWDREAWAGGNFVFALSTIFMPLCALMSSYLVVCARSWIRLSAIPIFVVVTFLLVTDGSRTPLGVIGAATWFFVIFRFRSLFMRITATIAICLSLAAVFSLMTNFRSYGFEGAAAATRKFEFVYAQDDNYYRSLHAFSVADQSDYRWDFIEFFQTIAVNPIPRAIWPDKPIINSDFYGDYKLGWTTNFFFGESVAMFGIAGGLSFAVVWGLILYLLLYRALGLLSKPLGLLAYLLVALYVYMCMRSMFSITSFMYLPIAGLMTVAVAERIARRRQPFLVVQAYPVSSRIVHGGTRPRQL